MNALIPAAMTRFGMSHTVSITIMKNIIRAGEEMKIFLENWKVILCFMIATILVSLPFDWLVLVNETLALMYLLVILAGAVHAGVLFNQRVHQQRGENNNE